MNEEKIPGTIFEDGYGLVPYKIMADKTLNNNAKSLFCYLLSFAGTKFIASPSRDIIMHDLNFGSQSTYYAALDELKERGLVSCMQDKKKGVSGKSVYGNNVFILNIYSEDIEK